MRRKRTADLVLLALTLALVAALAVLRAGESGTAPSVPSTYDAGTNGYAALYDLLAREGTRADRFELPIAQLPAGRATLVLAGTHALDAATDSPGAQAALDRWIRAGGTLAVFDDAIAPAVARAFGMPSSHTIAKQTRARAGCAFAGSLRGALVAGTFASGYSPVCAARRATVFAAASSAAGIAYRRGRGTIVLAATPAVFDNLHLSQAQNARVAYALLGGGRVLFDERIHGFSAGRTFWDVLPLPMRVALGLAVFAVLAAIAGANLPFAPPYEPEPPDERDSSAYIDSLAGMLERGGAARAALTRIAGRCEPALSSRPGDERARMLLRELRTLLSTPHPGAHDVLAAGRIFARVRKDYGC